MGKVKQREDKEEREREEWRREEEGGRLGVGVGGNGGWRKGGRGRRKEEDVGYPRREVLGIREPWMWKSFSFYTPLFSLKIFIISMYYFFTKNVR